MLFAGLLREFDWNLIGDDVIVTSFKFYTYKCPSFKFYWTYRLHFWLKNKRKSEWRRTTGNYNPKHDPINNLKRSDQTAIFRLRTGHCMRPSVTPEAHWYFPLSSLRMWSRANCTPCAARMSKPWSAKTAKLGTASLFSSWPHVEWGFSTTDRKQKKKKVQTFNNINYIWWLKWKWPYDRRWRSQVKAKDHIK